MNDEEVYEHTENTRTTLIHLQSRHEDKNLLELSSLEQIDYQSRK